MKPRHMVLAASLAGAALLAVFGDKSPDAGVAEPVERAPAQARVQAPPPAVSSSAAPAAPAASAAGAPAAPTHASPILALIPREILIGNKDEQFGQGEHGVFGRQDWTPPPPPPAPAPPPPPPSAPPLPFTFIGKSVADGTWEVYLARGDRTYVVRDKAVIDGTYRVDAIAPPLLTLTYLPLNTVQQLNIGVFD
jgi:pyruvate/2-oxoglutarate dehydrogenase complex dihydrolipoamide acyltransferase (E2) component